MTNSVPEAQALVPDRADLDDITTRRRQPVDEVSWHGPSVETDQGVSRLKGDLLCEAWRVINEGYETCLPVFRDPDGTAQGRDAYLFMTDTGIYPWSPIV